MQVAERTPQETIEFLNDIAIQSQYLATSLDNLTENLSNLLHSISSITSDNVDIFRNTVNNLSDTMDKNIKIMYTIISKTEEINKNFQKAEAIHLKIKDIRRLVDMLDNI